MTWLSKDVLGALEHAGYIAVPREKVKEFYAEEFSDAYETVMLRQEYRKDYNQARLKRMAVAIGMELLKAGFIDIQLDTPGPESAAPYLRHRATVQVVAPRTMGGPV